MLKVINIDSPPPLGIVQYSNNWYQSRILHYSLITGRNILLKTTMDQQEGIASNRAPELNKEGYALCNIRIRVYLQSLGYGIWNLVISDYIPPKIIRTTSQKKSKKNNSREMEAIHDGLRRPIKENIGQCISTKDLWVKLEKRYLVEQIAEAILDIFENDGDDEEPCSQKEDQRSKSIYKKKFNKN